MDSNVHPLDQLRKELPPTFARAEIGKLFGGIIAAGSVANEDSRGTGPKGLFYVGRRACYERESFLTWLETKLTRAKAKPVNRTEQAA